jgi:flagellar basal-body rod modification protein FlgD
MPDAPLSVTSAYGVAAQQPTTTGTAKLDKDAFLKLLVAQLKFQNPMSPTDPSQMMAQTAQFTMVESLQQISQAQVDAGAWQRVVAGEGMIGKQVTGANGDQVLSGVVTGMTLTADGPQLQLADGTKLPVSSVLSVSAAPSTPA